MDQEKVSKKKLSKRIKKFFGLKKKVTVELNNLVEYEETETLESVYELEFSDDDEQIGTIDFPQKNIDFDKLEEVSNQLVRRLSLESVRTVTLVRIPEKKEKEVKDLPSKIKEIFGEDDNTPASNPFQYNGFETVHGHGKFYEQTIMNNQLKRSHTELGKSKSVPQFSTQMRRNSFAKVDDTAILSINNILNDVELLIANLNKKDKSVNKETNSEPDPRKSQSLPRPETEKSKWSIVQQYVSQQITTPVEEPVAKELQMSGNRLQNRLKAIAHERVQGIKNPTLKSAFSEETIRTKHTLKSIESIPRPTSNVIPSVLEAAAPPMPSDTVTKEYLKSIDRKIPFQPEIPVKSQRRASVAEVNIYESFEQQLAELSKAIASINEVEPSPVISGAEIVEGLLDKSKDPAGDSKVENKESAMQEPKVQMKMAQNDSEESVVSFEDKAVSDSIAPEDAQSMNTSLDRPSTVVSVAESPISRTTTPVITIAHKRDGKIIENYESPMDKPLPESPRDFERDIKTETFEYEIQDFSPPTSRRNSINSVSTVDSSHVKSDSVNLEQSDSINSDDIPLLQRKISKMVRDVQEQESKKLTLKTLQTDSQKSLSAPELIFQGPGSPTSLQYNRNSRTISDPRLVAAGVEALPVGVTSTLVTQPDGKEQIVLNFGDEAVSLAERKFSVEPRRISLHETGSIRSHRVQSGESDSSVKFFDKFSFDRKRNRDSKSIDRNSKSFDRQSKSFDKENGIVGAIGSVMETLNRMKQKRPNTPERQAIETQLDPLYEQINKLDKSQFSETDINALLKAMDVLKLNKSAAGNLSPVIESPNRYDDPSTISLLSSSYSSNNRRSTPIPFNADTLYPNENKKESKPFLKRMGNKLSKGVLKMSSMNNILRKDTVGKVDMKKQSSTDTIDRIMASNNSRIFDNQRYVKKQ
ncbi:hypothetical protein HDV01_001693 [Terramyces sp. JEL0728]|nr:hypothetical protein HDV01_001693 [Terramyces sp. JEL0728]